MNSIVWKMLLFYFLILPFHVQGQTYLDENTIRTTGIASIINGNLAGARDTALKLALKSAVEQSCGTFISSEAKVKNFQMLESKIYSKSEGFIENYRIDKDFVDGNNYRIETLVTLKIETIKDELKALGLLIQDRGYPKIMLIVDETVKSEGKNIPVENPTLSSEIENALLKKGFILVAKDFSDQLRMQERELMAEVIADDQKAAEMALSHGAEMVIVGTNTISDLGVEFDFHQADAIAAIRTINASTAQVISNKKEHKRGASDTAENSYIESSKKLAAVIVDDIINGILQNWKQAEVHGSHFIVKLYGIKSYRKQGIKFINILKNVPGVTDVQQRSYGGSRLEVDLQSSYKIDELTTNIWNKLDGIHEFDDVDQKEALGNNIIFEFVK